MRSVHTLWLLGLLASGTQAQETAGAADPESGDGTQATDLETIRVIERRPERIDPFGFRSDFDPDDNMFNRRWNEPPSVEDVSLQGGYIQLGINYGLMRAAQAATRLPGVKNQTNPAIARPPPLDDAQLERARRLQDADIP